MWIGWPSACAAECTSFSWVSIDGLLGLTRTPISGAPGINSRSKASRLASISLRNMLTPVALPPGRLRPATRPSFTGSSPVIKTMGTVDVTAFATSPEAWPPAVTITATRISARLAAGQSIVVPLGPAECDVQILPLDVALFSQTLPERSLDRCRLAGRPDAEETDHRHRRLLRARRERPGDRHAAERR